ncbi:MAG: thiamine/thiamine pyrophosphate ABC transporter permease [Dongiaceae bacterium]
MDTRIATGIGALTAIGVLIGGAFAGLALEGVRDTTGALAAFDSYLGRVALFTVWQALLSTVLSVVPAVFVARALTRHPSFPGRQFILRLLALPLALPAIVAAMGVLALYGRAGYFSAPLATISGGSWPGIYGLSGILIAHVFFNLPLATRLFVQSLDTIPDDQWRLASQLGMLAGSVFRLLEWPTMRASLPATAGLVFMLCITSFTIVLTLGGGPGSTTIEVAIYQALRFDFDPARAVALTLAQIALTVAAVFVLSRLGGTLAYDSGLSVSPRRHVVGGGREALANGALIAVAVLFVGGPVAAIAAAGVEADLVRLAGERSVQRAVATSIGLAFAAALFAIGLSLALVAARRALELGRRPSARRRLLEYATGAGAGFVLVVPPIVIGAGWFILVRHVSDVFAIAPVMVVTVNAVMAMPFVVRAIRPAYDAASERHERLAAQLGIVGWNRFRLVDWPSLRRPLATGLAFAMALSIGDLGVIALFGSDAVQTLPYLLLQRMGSYRTADAAGLALFLAVLCLLLMTVAEQTGRSRHERC